MGHRTSKSADPAPPYSMNGKGSTESREVADRLGAPPWTAPADADFRHLVSTIANTPLEFVMHYRTEETALLTEHLGSRYAAAKSLADRVAVAYQNYEFHEHQLKLLACKN
jgi:hypothetical protein